MLLLHLPVFLTTTFAAFAHWLDRRSGKRLPLLLIGILLARGRRTCTSWFRAAGITDEFRPAYTTINAVGRESDTLALTTLRETVKPLLTAKRLTVAIDDTPTPRYGPEVEGCGIHHNPTPGPAGEEFVYGHVWVTLAALVHHPQWNIIALPLQAQLYIRKVDLEALLPDRRRPFHTKLELAAQQLQWLKPWVEGFEERWAAVDGGYAKKPFLRPAQLDGWVVVGRLRKDAALWSLPRPKPPGRHGPAPTYGKERLSLAKRAGHRSGWQQVECVQYGETLTKTIKTFVATWRPAGGAIRVVLIQEQDGWVAFFCTNPEASAEEILAAAADRGAIEQTFKDVKEIWGAGQQQVRNIHSNEGCFNLNLWMYSLVEAWAWNQRPECVCDRSASPWDSEPRRPSHNDKRKALQREVLQSVIQEGLSGRPTKERMRALAERLLELAA